MPSPFAVPTIRLAFAILSMFVLALINVPNCLSNEPPSGIEVISHSAGEHKIFIQESLLLKSFEDITSVAIADPSICGVVQDANDPRRIVLTGKRYGDTTVTLWHVRPDQGPTTLKIRVRLSAASLTSLEDFLNAEYPRASIKLKTVPFSGNLVVTGSVASNRQATEILAMLGGGHIPQTQLVSGLEIKPDLIELERYLNETYPAANIRVTVVPVSKKLLLSGCVRDQQQINVILQMIVGEAISSDRVVNDLKLYCTCIAVPCRVLRRRR